MVSSLRDHIRQTLFCPDLIAEEVNLCDACDPFALCLRKLREFVRIRLVQGVEFLEAFVTGDNEDIVSVFEKSVQFFAVFQRILGIIHHVSPF